MNFPKLDIEIIENCNSINMKIKKYLNSSSFAYMNGGTYIFMERTGNIVNSNYPIEIVPYMFGYIPIKQLVSKYSYTFQREIWQYRVKKI
jgi:hypothetical protein